MISRIIPILILGGLLLSGCYSHLRYSEAAHQKEYFREVQTPSPEVAPDDLTNNAYKQHILSRGFPFHYKNYSTAEWYARHGFENMLYYGIGMNPFSGWSPGYGITVYSLHDTFPLRSRYYAYTPLNFGPWVCWDPPYSFPGYYPSSITIFVGGGSGPLYYPGVSKGKSGARMYGRRGIGTNRVKAGRDDQGRSGILNTVRNIMFPNNSSGTIRTRGTDRTSTIGTSSNNGPRIRSTGRSSSSSSSSRGRSRGN